MGIPTVKIESYPNNEVRCVFWYAPLRRDNSPPVNDRNSGSTSPLPSLDITSELETQSQSEESTLSSNVKPGYGAPGTAERFTTYARRSMLRAGGALERTAAHPGETIFLTGTLPGSTYEAKKAIGLFSAWAVHRVKAWIAKRVPNKMDMYCWEFQKRGALHLHYAVWVPDAAARAKILANWKAQWTRIIDGIGERARVDMWRKNKDYTHANRKEVLQADAQECTKSISRYLSKYISKCERQREVNHWEKCKPSRFWGISRPLLALTKSMSNSETFVLANRRQLEATYEDVLSITESQCHLVYKYEVRQQEARVVAAFSHDKEEHWIWNQLRRIMPGTPTLSQSTDDPKTRMITEISRCLSGSWKLRKCASVLFGQSWVEQVITMRSPGLPHDVWMDRVLMDFHSLVGVAESGGLRPWPALRSLKATIHAFFRERWVDCGRPMPSPVPSPEKPTEPCTPSIEQLTLPW